MLRAIWGNNYTGESAQGHPGKGVEEGFSAGENPAYTLQAGTGISRNRVASEPGQTEGHGTAWVGSKYWHHSPEERKEARRRY